MHSIAHGQRQLQQKSKHESGLQGNKEAVTRVLAMRVSELQLLVLPRFRHIKTTKIEAEGNEDAVEAQNSKNSVSETN